MHIRPLGTAIEIGEGEQIMTEISRKFVVQDLTRYLACFGLEAERAWTDEREWFAEMLLKKRESAPRNQRFPIPDSRLVFRSPPHRDRVNPLEDLDARVHDSLTVCGDGLERLVDRGKGLGEPLFGTLRALDLRGVWRGP